MKKNNKGFMLFETLVVSTVVLGALIFLYVQFSSVKRSYDINFRYNTIPGLFYAKNLEGFLKEDGYEEILVDTNASENGYVDITNCLYSSSLCSKIIENSNMRTVLFTINDISTLQNYVSENNVFNDTFKKFILSLPTTTTNQKPRLIIEYSNDTFAAITIGEATE